MANRISNVLTALETALKTLVPTKLAAVRRGLVRPQGEQNRPVLALAIEEFHPVGGAGADRRWEAQVVLALVLAQGQSDVDETLIDLVAEIQAVVDALAAAGTCGGAIDQPRWDPWYSPKADVPLAPIGAIGSLRIQVGGPLKVA